MPASNLALVLGPTLFESRRAGGGVSATASASAAAADAGVAQRVLLRLMQLPSRVWVEADDVVSAFDNGTRAASPVPEKKVTKQARKRKSRTPGGVE
eukprot:UC1_evm1s1620